jgi:hypothetical protein
MRVRLCQNPILAARKKEAMAHAPELAPGYLHLQKSYAQLVLNFLENYKVKN